MVLYFLDNKKTQGISILENTPLIIISWFPRLAPYVLKSKLLIFFPFKYFEVNESNFILPAGDMWSVVIESPKSAITLAFKILQIFLFYKLNILKLNI